MRSATSFRMSRSSIRCFLECSRMMISRMLSARNSASEAETGLLLLFRIRPATRFYQATAKHPTSWQAIKKGPEHHCSLVPQRVLKPKPAAKMHIINQMLHQKIKKIQKLSLHHDFYIVHPQNITHTAIKCLSTAGYEVKHKMGRLR